MLDHRIVKRVLALALLFSSPASAQTLGPSAGIQSSGSPAAHWSPPLVFEPNRGQAAPGVDFLARGHGYALFLRKNDFVLVLGSQESVGQAVPKTPDVVRVALAGANRTPRISAETALPGRSHYFIGDDPARWHVDIPTYARVRYSEVYPGVDMVFHGAQGQLEYDFVVRPGTRPETISLSFDGASRIRVDPSGDLILSVGSGEARQHRPVIYQDIDGYRRAVSGKFEIREEGRIGFRIGQYDPTRELVIDPVLSYSTFLGGSSGDRPYGITVDTDGGRICNRLHILR